MKAAPFEYHRASSATEAAELLAEHGEGARILAGGQSLIPMLALRLAVFEHLVDIGRVQELHGIERRNGHLWVGAATPDARIERDPQVAEAVPLLAKATPHVGHFQIRARGTVGGSIAHADPAAEYPAVAVALDAEAHVLSTRGSRTIAASELYEGHWTTTIAPDEVLLGVSFPVWNGRSGFAVEELTRRHGDFAIAGATVGIELDGDDRVVRCAIGLLGVGSTPERAARAEAAAQGQPVDELDVEALGHEAMADLEEIPSDAHGSAAYRRRVGAVMVARALQAAIGDARDG